MIKKTSLKLFTFRTLKILWFNCFRLKKHMYCQIPFGLLYRSAVFFIVILISVSNISPRIIMKRKIHGRRNQTTRYLRQKRCWKFPQKREHERWGKVWYTPSLKLFTFRTLKILWFNCFRLKKHMYCQIPFGLLYRSAVFFIVILISVSNISPRIIMKRKATAVETKPPFTFF